MSPPKLLSDEAGTGDAAQREHLPEGSVDTQARTPFPSCDGQRGATHYLYHVAGSNLQQFFFFNAMKCTSENKDIIPTSK